ncbi:hypothetical protein [Pseudidiomarina insulisalsae]|uniref:Uncharacterized protein n=1 Tax=Pseudidiomarina insulisalsae TaxID=575789 RepID=A0A432YQ50_9GAMM|nr:hypothetical protein [Pseudidiomarina insulisalsae]RUO63525.1 hypothetical protein CWI71_00210 [Pseudidiomarina insulisalsae]
MKRVKIIAASLTVLSLLSSGPIAAKTVSGQEPAAKVIRLVASTIGLSRDELNRAFFVIADFQARKLTLPELDALSDDQVLAKIDFDAEPYASLESEQMMLIAKRYELEVEMLASRANVDIEKFRQFYRTFDMTMTTALSLNRYAAAPGGSAAGAKSSAHATLSYFDDDDFDGPVVECGRSCRVIIEQMFDDFQDQLDIIAAMQDWENQNGAQPVGTTARIVDSESGSFIEVQKQLSSVPWAPLSTDLKCATVACS